MWKSSLQIFKKINCIRTILLGGCVISKQVLNKVINKINNKNYVLAVLGGAPPGPTPPLVVLRGVGVWRAHEHPGPYTAKLPHFGFG